ncbi:MAG: CaiB/BaiF CoA transferase family protein [Acidimicrobiales bacterium]
MAVADVGPLSDLRILDISTVLAGPMACQILGDYGADVIKIEHPSGDTMRGHGAQVDGDGLWWKIVARNKRCLGLYLGDPAGAAVFEKLVETADVVVENFRPGTLERWGLGYDRLSELNPGIVLCRVTGFGQEGPYADRPAFGTLIEAMSGFAHMTGEADRPPTLPPFGLADSVAGITAVSAILMAIHSRERTGQGQVVDLSILEPLTAALGPHIINHDQTGAVQTRSGNRSSNNSPRNTYLTADEKWVAVSSSAESVAKRAMELVGRPELADEPWFTSGAGRAEHADEIDAAMGSWIGARGLDEVVHSFAEAEVALAPVYDVAQYVADPQVRARGAVATVEDKKLGPVSMQNVLFKLSETPGRIRHTGRAIGEDTDEILGELELTDDQLATLRTDGVIE